MALENNGKNVLRLSAEETFREEIQALIEAEKDPVPAGCQMSPRSVLTYICGGKVGKTEITPKYIGDKRLRRRYSVHLCHIGVQMQFDPLDRRRILPQFVFNHIDMHRIELDVFSVPCLFHFALYAQPYARFYRTFQIMRFICVQILPYGYRTAVIRHVNGHDPDARTACFPALKPEYFPGYGN